MRNCAERDAARAGLATSRRKGKTSFTNAAILTRSGTREAKMITNRQWIYARKPTAEVGPDNFDLRERPVMRAREIGAIGGPFRVFFGLCAERAEAKGTAEGQRRDVAVRPWHSFLRASYTSCLSFYANCFSSYASCFSSGSFGSSCAFCASDRSTNGGRT